ncbi:MAG: HAMP domain-containing sensor histidine kinase [Gammaproteobacteria bacterium]
MPTPPSSSPALSVQERLALLEEQNASLVQRVRALSVETRSQAQLIRTLFDFTPFGLAIFNPQHQLIQVNSAGQGLLQKNRALLVGMPCTAIFDCEAHAENCAVLAGQPIEQRETRCAARLNNDRTFLRSAVRTDSDEGPVVLEAFIDISEIKQAERAKNDFLAKMSHELRTPLNAIVGLTELLRDELAVDDPGPSHDYLNIMRSASRDLQHIIDELLDVAKIRGNNLRLDMHITSVTDLVAQLEQDVHQNSGHGSRLRVRLHSEVNTVYADPQRLQQILQHLLANAFVYAGDSEVCLRIQRQAGRVEFVVSDQGGGMSEEQVRRVFNEFEQGDNTSTRQHGGVGLGLSIAYHLAHLMGGTLSIESQLNAGTRVSLSLAEVEPSSTLKG